MWEAIQANQRKSVILLLLLVLVLAAVGYLIAGVFGEEVAPFGILTAIGVWIILIAVAFAGGEQVLLSSAGAREISKDDAPQLYNIVEEMKIAAGLPAMPRVYIIPSAAPNAFAVGLNPERAAVAVTTGLLSRLNRDELQGVIAHEIGHIANRDTRFMTLAGVTVGSIIILTDLFFRLVYWSGGGRGRRSRRSDGAALVLFALVLAIVAPLIARLLYFACSRRREYLADACAALYTRYPEGLASALEKISNYHGETLPVNEAVAPMFTVNPSNLRGGGLSLFSTHPPTEDRIRILRSMAGASWAAYEEAYRKTHKGRGLLKSTTLSASPEQPVRERSAEAAPNPIDQWRAANDLFHTAAGYAIIPCPCGLRIKVPPSYAAAEITCPRCGRKHSNPIKGKGPSASGPPTVRMVRTMPSG